MRGAIPQLLQYTFMAWCSVESIEITLPLPLKTLFIPGSKKYSNETGNAVYIDMWTRGVELISAFKGAKLLLPTGQLLFTVSTLKRSFHI